MTSVAAIGLDDVQPLALALQSRRHAIATGSRAGEQALVRDLKQGIPEDRRIIFRRSRRVRCRRRGQVYDIAGRSPNLRRIDQAVAAHPHAVICLWQVGHHIAPATIGDDDLGEFGRQVGRFRDDPDAGFRPVGAGHHACEVVVADRDGFQGALLGAHRGPRQECQNHSDGARHVRAPRSTFRLHLHAPPLVRAAPPGAVTP